MTAESGEPGDDVARAEAGLTSTIFGVALARAPRDERPSLAVARFLAVTRPVGPVAVVGLDAGAVDDPPPDPGPLVPAPLAPGDDVPVAAGEPPLAPAGDDVPLPAPVAEGALPADDDEDEDDDEDGAAPDPTVGGAVVVVDGGAVVVVVPPPFGPAFAARTDVGVKGGWFGPKTQAVTLPGGGLYVMAPSCA